MSGAEKRHWERNGQKYWQIKTADAEIVAVMPWSYTPYFPPMHAKYEIYTVKKGMSTFAGYLEGEQLARTHLYFQNAFSKGL